MEGLGDCLTLVGAIMDAIFAIGIKMKVSKEKEETFRFSLFFGLIGLSNMLIILPFFFLANWTGFETFEWPDHRTLLMLSVNALLGSVTSDYCWARSVVLLGPLVT